jgi:hypothetical protein
MSYPQKSETPQAGGEFAESKKQNTENAAIVAVGVFPRRINTVLAEVLARMLRGEALTGMDGVFDCSTTRLASSVFQLRSLNGWKVLSDERTVECKDGRMTKIVAYRLDADTIERARAAGGDEWIAGVMTARAELRAQKHAKAKKAARIEAAARAASCTDTVTLDLFGSLA